MKHRTLSFYLWRQPLTGIWISGKICSYLQIAYLISQINSLRLFTQHVLHVHIHSCGRCTLLVCRHFLVISSHECCSYQLHFEWLVDLSHLKGWCDALEWYFLEEVFMVENWKWNRVLRNRTGRRKPVNLLRNCSVVEFGTTADKSRSQWSERDLNPSTRTQFASAPTKPPSFQRFYRRPAKG